MGKQKKVHLVDMIQEKKDVKEEIERLKEEMGALPPLTSLLVEIGDARTRLENFVQQHGEGSEGDVPANLKSDLHEHKSTLEGAKKAHQDLKRSQEDLSARLEDLCQRLAGMQYLCSEEEVLDHQQALAQAEQKVVELKATIAQQEQAVRDASDGIPTMGGLLERREDLLAEIATGNVAAENQLVDLDQEIEERTKQIDAAREHVAGTVTRSKAAVAGLQRKLAEAEETAAEIRDVIHPAAVVAYLTSRAEIAGEEFVQMAQDLIQKHNQLMGLGYLLKQAGPAAKNILTSGWDTFEIPAFNLKAFEGKRHGFDARLMFTFRPTGDGREAAVEAERKKMQAMGIRL